jgi:hypothetical protein
VRGDWKKRLDVWNGGVSRHQFAPDDREAWAGKGQARAVMELYRRYADERGASVCGEKSPTYLDKLARLSQLYPEAGFIVIWRNPEAIWASAVRAGRDQDWFRQFGLYARLVRAMRKALGEVRALAREGIPVLEVTYDELVAAPDATLEKVWHFLGLEPVTLEEGTYRASADSLPQGGHHDQVRSGRVEAVKHRDAPLTPREQHRVRAMTARLGVAFPESPFHQLDWAKEVPPHSALRSAGTLTVAEVSLALDRCKRLLFSLLPLSAWVAYRKWRRQAEAATEDSAISSEDSLSA